MLKSREYTSVTSLINSFPFVHIINLSNVMKIPVFYNLPFVPPPPSPTTKKKKIGDNISEGVE